MHKKSCGLCKSKLKCEYNCNENKELQDLDADKILEQYGSYGLYQLLGFYCAVLFFLPAAAQFFVMPFIASDLNMVCVDKDGNNLTEFYKNPEDSNNACKLKDINNTEYYCGEKDTQLIMFDNIPVKSMLYQFNISCENFFIKEAGYTFFTVGQFMTSFLSILADKFGRKPVLTATIILKFILCAVCGFLPKYWMFILCRFFTGLLADGLITICSILACELVVQDMRSYVGLGFTFTWASGYFYVGLISVFGLSYKMFYFVSSLPSLLMMIYLFLIPESPYWLTANKKYCSIYEYIIKTTKFNKQSIDLNKCKINDSRRKLREEAVRNKDFGQYKIGFKRPIFITYTFIIGFVQFIIQLYYFALTYSSLELSDDPFIGYMLSGFVEIPGGIIAIPLMKFFGRKPLTILTLIFQGIFIILYPYMKILNYDKLAIIFNLCGKLFNGILQVVFSILVVEIMPTKMRTVMYSVVKIPQCLGILLAPFIKYTTFGYPPTPMLILAVISITAGLLCFLLPETKGKKLPEDISEIDKGILGRCCRRKKKRTKHYGTDGNTIDDTQGGIPSLSGDNEESPENHSQPASANDQKKELSANNSGHKPLSVDNSKDNTNISSEATVKNAKTNSEEQ